MADLSGFTSRELLAELTRRLQEGDGSPLTPGEASGAGVSDADLSRLWVAYIGNFEPPHSTENEYRKAWEAAGAGRVDCFQESHINRDRGDWNRLAGLLWEAEEKHNPQPNLIMWTRTVWPEMDYERMRAVMDTAGRLGIPIVGVHLDIWHGLPRASEIDEHPFFRSDLLFTADGGHPDEWKKAGIEHVWLPPGVSEFECVPTEPNPNYEAAVAFVGGWQGGYHPESHHRHELVRYLRKHGARMFPAEGQPAVRGEALRRLYATTKVNVGDSCFAGTGLANYWSDRIPETLGRGGFLLHPYVPGIEDHFTDGEHLRLWEAGNWGELGRLIDYYLSHEDERRQIAKQGRAHVLAHHTYTVRVRQIVATMRERGLL